MWYGYYMGRVTSQFRRNAGFTLIELLIVIAIIGILAALIIVSLSGARAKAKDTKIKNNLASITSILSQYHVDNKGAYPDSGAAQWTLSDADFKTALTAYLSNSSSEVFTFDTVTTGYGTPAAPDNTKFLAAAGLNSTSESPITSGNGVYQTNGSGRAGEIDANGLTLGSADGFEIHDGNGASVDGRAFVTYGPQ